MEEIILNAALAGLLHDVGKIKQRGTTIPPKTTPGYEGKEQRSPDTFSENFIQTLVPPNYRTAALAGVYHHQPEASPAEGRFLSKLIALADRLSAGEKADSSSQAKNLPGQMITVFDRVAMDVADKGSKDWKYLPLRPLSLNRNTLFPGPQDTQDMNSQGYRTLLDVLTSAVRQDPGDLLSYLENVQGALQAAAWCVPSDFYHSAPDVSLYDHSRMTAALAVCLSGKSENEIDRLLAETQSAYEKGGSLSETPAALLIGGDISGIQDFIYTISSKKAAKTLRGRSFYLQLLTEAVLRYVLATLDLPYTNVIYSGGGHFFLLAPVHAQEKMAGLRKAVTEKILTHHGTDLYFALGSAVVPVSGFKPGIFPDFWKAMHADLGLNKQRRYTELGPQMHSWIFEVADTGGNPDSTCSVCGEDVRQTQPFDDNERQAHICSLCASFAEEIGDDLPNAKFIALGWETPQDSEPGTASDALQSFGLRFQLMGSHDDQIVLEGIHHATIWALDDPEKGWPKAENIPVSHLLRYTVNAVSIMTFDELQDEVKGGFKQLGVLRMDVDNLGNIFKKGLRQYATLARISTLSFQMSLFFEGWIKRICEMDDFKGKIYAVYAGGDDVFLIGPWDVMPDLALQIRDDFASYTGEHKDFHISAGLAFIGGKYPVYQAADDAEQAVSAAKGGGRDSFSYLGSVWKWDEFVEMKKKFKQIVHMVSPAQEGGLDAPQAVIQILRNLAEQRAKKTGNSKSKNKEVWGRWMWMGVYMLQRMEERETNKPDLVRELKKIREDLERHHYANLNEWGTAARWAQLFIR